MQSFEYAAPDTLEEGLALLRAHGAEAKVLAGGQSLVPLLNYRLARPRLGVDIAGLPLAHVRAEDGWLRVGALARHHELEELTEIARACPLLPEVARLIGNVRVRSLGTVGGSLAHADPAAELPLAMVALDARLTLASASGRRVVAARDFFTGYLSTVLGADELLTEIAVPVTRGMGWAVEEFARCAGDFAVVAGAAGVSLDRRGRVDGARVTFAGVAGRPVRATAAEDALRGQEPSVDRLARVAEIARDGLDPQSDAFVSGAYRRLLAGVLARRALGRAVALSAAPSSEGAAVRAAALPPQSSWGFAPSRERFPRPRRGPSRPPPMMINGRARVTFAAAPATPRSSTQSRPTHGDMTAMAETVAPDTVALGTPLRLVGRALPRHDARDKVAAATAYAADWAMPGMLHAAVLRSPYPSARILKLETAGAERMPGVAVVLTAKDVPRNTLSTDVPGQTTAVGPLRATLYVLAQDRVRHQGEPVALVAAEPLGQAPAAAVAIDAGAEPLPGVFGPEAALAPDAPRVHETGNVLAEWRTPQGHLERGFRRETAVDR